MSEEAKEEVVEDRVPHIDTKNSKKLLRVPLTNEELLQHGADLAEAQQELDEINDELKTIKADYKMRTTAIEARAAKLGNLVRQKYDLRQVEVEITLDFDEGIVTVVRLDNDEVAEQRPMDDDEKKRELNLFPNGEEKGEGNLEPDIGHIEIHEAVKIIQGTKRANPTAIQRRMGVSSMRACLIIDKLEELKVVGAPQEDGEPREVLMDEVAIQRFLEDYPGKAEEKAVESAQEALQEDQEVAAT